LTLRGRRSLALEAAGPPAATPEVAGDDTVHVVLDGTLHGDLDGAGSVLRAYRERGEAVLPRLRGAFALVIWDADRQRLLCVRDPLGIYPLFYADAGPELLISTSLEALTRHPGVSRDLNRVLLAEHLLSWFPAPEQTCFTAVARVLPGSVTVVEASGRRSSYRSWNPALQGDTDNGIGAGDRARFGELLDRAVDRCLELGPAGIYLSGGIDSVSIAAVAARRSRQAGRPRPLALSLVFPDPECNEEETQRRVAADLGLPSLVLPLQEATGPSGIVAAGVHRSSGLAAPLLNCWLPAYERLAAEAGQRGCRVILSGGGGDEWLGVSPYLAADLLSGLDLPEFWRFILSWRRSYALSAPQLARSAWEFGVRPVVASPVRTRLARTAPGVLARRRLRRNTRALPDWLAPDPALRRAMLERSSAPAAAAEPAPDESSLGHYRADGSAALAHPFVAMEKEENFDYSRRLGIVLRAPYWDAELVEFLYRTPPAVLASGGRNKGLARSLLAERFPELGFERQKKIVSINYFASLVGEEGPRAWRDLGGMEALGSLGVVDGPRAAETMEPALRLRDARTAGTYWNLLVLESWVRQRM
jgi:asparagine synthase (glutamine-hydrolysing)